jgi:hypothetical protein
MTERERILKKARRHALTAKKVKTNVEFTLKYGEETSLSKVIKTKEQADLFMKLLRLA